MTIAVDTRPSGVNLVLRPGTTVTLTLEWPAGSLAGRTFTSTLDGDALTPTVNGDTMTIEATDTQTGALTIGVPVPWLLNETIGGTPEAILIGQWTPSNSPRAISSQTVQVTQGASQVTVAPLSGATVAQPATVIAASDAPADIQARADVVVDGTDDEVEINAALATGPVELSQGTFNVRADPDGSVLVPSDRRLRGQGPGVTIVSLQPADLANDTLFPGLNSWGIINGRFTDAAPGRLVSISDLTVDGNKAAMISLGNENQGEAVDIKHCDDYRVDNLHVVNGTADGIDIDFGRGHITDVTIEGCRGSGIHLSGGFPAGGAGTATRWTVVNGAIISDCGADFSRWGVDITLDSSDNVLADVVLRDNNGGALGNEGLRIAGIRNIAHGVYAEDNRLVVAGDDNILDGFYIRGDDNMGLNRPLEIGDPSSFVGNNNRVANGVCRAGVGWQLTSDSNTVSNVADFGAFGGPVLGAPSANNQVVGCHATSAFTDSGTGNRITASTVGSGRSEASGTATIADGQSSVVVPHGLYATPASAVATARTVATVAVTARDGTNITIARSGTTGALNVDWAAHI